MQQRWPDRLWVVRHGESVGNLARQQAKKAGLPALNLDLRDPDVPLSDLGREQAQALGRWFGALPPAEQPEVVLVSPYDRDARDRRADRARGRNADRAGRFCLRRAAAGEGTRHPRSADRGRHRDSTSPSRPGSGICSASSTIGHPAGESWCDVILRLRSLLDTVSLHHAGCRHAGGDPPGRHPVPALPARRTDRGAAARDRSRRRRGQLLRHRIRVRSRSWPPRGHGAATI